MTPADDATVEGLQAERELLEAVIGALDDGVVALDDQGCLLLANPAARALLDLGTSAAGAILLDRVRVPAVHQAVGAALGGDVHECDAELPGPPMRNLRLRAGPTIAGGALLVLTDRTRIARLERVRRDFVVNVGHELRTPVSIVAASAEALTSGALDDPVLARQFVDAIKRNAERLAVLVTDLLDLSRIESGRQVLVRRALSVAEAVEDAVASLDFAIASAEVDVVVQPTPAVGSLAGAMVHADATATQQILVNLLHNALQHSERGGRITVTIVEEHDMMRVSVIDEGPGIAASLAGRLFERFYRAELGRERNVVRAGGSGLGLAIVKHLVNAMGGVVGVQSPASDGSAGRGPGSRFFFTLPLHRSVFSSASPRLAGSLERIAPPQRRDTENDEAAILALGPGVQELRRRLLRMAGRVEEMIGAAVRAVVLRDAELALRTIECDRAVNQDELEADELCLELLGAAPQSAAELRFVTRSAKMVTDLERIADLAVNICERVVPLAGVEWPDEEETIAQMAAIAQAMVRDVMDAFVAGDVAAARAVIMRDDEVDHFYHDVSRRLIAAMASDVRLVEGGMHMQAVAKFLERIGDHATNLGEQVIFMMRGDDIRHAGKRDLSSADR